MCLGRSTKKRSSILKFLIFASDVVSVIQIKRLNILLVCDFFKGNRKAFIKNPHLIKI